MEFSHIFSTFAFIHTHTYTHPTKHKTISLFQENEERIVLSPFAHTHIQDMPSELHLQRACLYKKKSYWSYVIVESWQIFSLQRFIWCVLLFLSVFRVTWQCSARFVLNFRFLLKYTFLTFIPTQTVSWYNIICKKLYVQKKHYMK